MTLNRRGSDSGDSTDSPPLLRPVTYRGRRPPARSPDLRSPGIRPADPLSVARPAFQRRVKCSRLRGAEDPPIASLAPVGVTPLERIRLRENNNNGRL